MWSVVAYAAEAGKAPSVVEQFMPFIFIILVFYFLMIRPQQKRQKVQQSFLENLKRGDSVLTTGGILGTIEGLTEKFVTLEISNGVRVRLLRSHISSTAATQEEKK